MAGKVKTWVWVVLGIVVVGILCIIAAAGVGLYFFSQHIQTRAASPANGDSVAGRCLATLDMTDRAHQGNP